MQITSSTKNNRSTLIVERNHLIVGCAFFLMMILPSNEEPTAVNLAL
jgi:hypothetical protein